MRTERSKKTVVWIAAFMGCVVFAGAMLAGVVLLIGEHNSVRAELFNSHSQQPNYTTVQKTADSLEADINKLIDISGWAQSYAQATKDGEDTFAYEAAADEIFGEARRLSERFRELKRMLSLGTQSRKPMAAGRR